MLTNICTIGDIERFVSEIERDYQSTQGLILSEYDAQCLLFAKISAHLAANNNSRAVTDDPAIYASPLHTEIKFLDENGKLLIRPDITVLDVRNISLVNDDSTRLVARKGFVFYGSAIVIELKFCKSRIGIDQRFTRSVRTDCEKISEIHQRLYPAEEEPTFSGCVVVFSRSNRRCAAFNQLIGYYTSDPVVRVIHATGNLNR